VTRPLNAADREFFRLVSRAAYANPFAAERHELDAQIGQSDAEDPELMARLVARLEARLTKLRTDGRLDLDEYDASDREEVLAALSFWVFHRYLEQLDRVVAIPGKLDFAEELLGDLVAGGFTASRAVRMLGLFFQLRRAHLAIGRTLVGRAPSVRRLRADLWNGVFTHDVARYERSLWDRMQDFSILLEGETGTGKGEAARALGRSGFLPFDEASQRFASSDALYVPVHLAAVPATLIESELFGHRRGAFTGASENREGALARVKPHGTLFLDEIGEIEPSAQVKLLRVLQEREFTPLGARDILRFQGRVVAATHESIDALRERGAMRADFYHRIATHRIELPNLRTRIAEDPRELSLLVEHVIARVVGAFDEPLTRQVTRLLEADLGPSYPFPGNVRELEQCVRRVLLTGRCAPDARAHITPESRSLGSRVERGELDAATLLREYCRVLHARTGSYVEVGRITGLDRRTVTKYVAGEPTSRSEMESREALGAR
jgi:DNA-binding NtrC family response regulator